MAWLTDPEIALWALVIMGVWKVLGYNLILFLVGIRNIPAQLSRGRQPRRRIAWQQFRLVTLPLLRPILLYVLVTATINAFNVFTQVYVMTLGSQAAPGQAVRVLVFDIYQNAFQYFHMGYASAEAVTLTLIVLGFTLIQFRFMREREAHDEARRRTLARASALLIHAVLMLGARVHGPADALDGRDLVQAAGRDRRVAAAPPAAARRRSRTTAACSRRRRSAASSSTASASRWSRR